MSGFHEMFHHAKEQAQQAFGGHSHHGGQGFPGQGPHPGGQNDSVGFPGGQQPEDGPKQPIPHSDREPVIPKMKHQPKILGLVEDPGLNRDSIAAATARFGDRVLWAARDSQRKNPQNGQVIQFPIVCSTASWTDFRPDGHPALHQVPPGKDPFRHTALRAYGENSTKQAFFPILKGQGEPPAGLCKDGTRYAIWPDCPPTVTHTGADGHVISYNFIKKAQISNKLQNLVEEPATSLHRIDYNPSHHGHGETLPKVTVVEEEFWKNGEINYGTYGTVVEDGMVYLYAHFAKNNVALAKVPANQIEHKQAYEYWIDGGWSKQTPHISQVNRTNIVNASALGQGTYFFNSHPSWNCYVWIGGTKFPGANFWITTAPRPEGPWIKPFEFYKAPNGNNGFGAYTLQAQPVLVKDMSVENAVYLTYTKLDDFHDGVGSVYTTPLVYVEWQ